MDAEADGVSMGCDDGGEAGGRDQTKRATEEVLMGSRWIDTHAASRGAVCQR